MASWARTSHLHGLRWQRRILLSGKFSSPWNLQFHLFKLHKPFCFSVSSLHHILAHYSGTHSICAAWLRTGASLPPCPYCTAASRSLSSVFCPTFQVCFRFKSSLPPFPFLRWTVESCLKTLEFPGFLPMSFGKKNLYCGSLLGPTKENTQRNNKLLLCLSGWNKTLFWKLLSFHSRVLYRVLWQSNSQKGRVNVQSRLRKLQ